MGKVQDSKPQGMGREEGVRAKRDGCTEQVHKETLHRDQREVTFLLLVYF